MLKYVAAELIQKVILFWTKRQDGYRCAAIWLQTLCVRLSEAVDLTLLRVACRGPAVRIAL